MSNVPVTALYVGTNISYSARSSDDGTYVIPSLPVGEYKLSARADGFKTFQRSDITLEVAQTLKLDMALEIGAITETVTVSGEVFACADGAIHARNGGRAAACRRAALKRETSSTR